LNLTQGEQNEHWLMSRARMFLMLTLGWSHRDIKRHTASR